MDKTLIIVVDRDDDFGTKAGIDTPAIGIDECMRAATALATADPEDSDTNALFKGISIYRQMEAEAGRPADSFDIALICGDTHVGYHSDEILTQELDAVLERTNPGGVILVDDGAEDEYIYPIIASRIRIKSVEKVYVKQAPSVEGTIYILSKYLKDPSKKQRFIAPLGFTLMAITAVYLIANALVAHDLKDYFLMSTTIFIALILSILLICYSYDVMDRINNVLRRLVDNAKDGSGLVFILIAIVLVVTGILIGVYSLDSVYSYRDTQKVIIFMSNALWPVLFALMFYHFGSVVSGYLSHGSIRFGSIVGCLYIVGAGLVTTALIDFLLIYTEVYTTGTNYSILEMIAGIAFFVMAVIIRSRLARTAHEQVQ